MDESGAASHEPPFSFAAKLRHAHIRDFNQFVQDRAAHGPWVYYGSFAVAALAALAIAEVTSGWFAVGVLAGYIVALVIGEIHARRIAPNRALKDGGSFLGTWQMVVDEEGFHSVGDNARSTIRWAAFDDVTVGPRTILLWTDPAYGYALPRTALGEHEAAIIAYIRARIAEARVSHPAGQT